MQAFVKRIHKEKLECIENNIDIISDSDYNMSFTMFGPVDSEYEGGIFNLKVKFPPNYPFEPPSVQFVDKIFHPNISTDGRICIDILKDKWSAALTFFKVILSIQSLLADPNPNSPLNGMAANLYLKDKREYKKICQQYIREYANGS